MKLKIGVAKVGHLGKIHIRILKELNESYELIGFYDQIECKGVSQEYGIKSFDRIDDIS